MCTIMNTIRRTVQRQESIKRWLFISLYPHFYLEKKSIWHCTLLTEIPWMVFALHLRSHITGKMECQILRDLHWRFLLHLKLNVINVNQPFGAPCLGSALELWRAVVHFCGWEHQSVDQHSHPPEGTGTRRPNALPHLWAPIDWLVLSAVWKTNTWSALCQCRGSLGSRSQLSWHGQ